MSRNSYPILRKFVLLITVMDVVAIHAVAQQAGIKTVKSGFFQSSWFLLLLFVMIICFSIVYRKFMYNRLLASNKNQSEKSSDEQSQSIEGLLDQVVMESGRDNVKTHTKVVTNLLHTIELIIQQAPFFQRDMVTNSLQETSQRLFTLSLLQGKIYQKGHLEFVDLHELVPIMIDNFTSTSESDSKVRFIYSSTSRSIEMPVQQAISIAFFINEVLDSFGSIKSGNYISESVGIYLQESKGLVKLTVRTEGLNVPLDFISLKRNLHQQVYKYFPEVLQPRLIIDQSLGTSIHLQFQNQLSKVPVAY